MKKVVAIMMMCVLLSSTSAFAGGYGSKYGKGIEGTFYKKAHMLMKARQELTLSQEQVDAIRELKYTTKKEVIMVSAEIDVLAIDIKQLLRQDPIDVDALEPLIEKKYELKRDKALKIVTAMATLKSLLTSEQKTYLEEHPWKDEWKKKECKESR